MNEGNAYWELYPQHMGRGAAEQDRYLGQPATSRQKTVRRRFYRAGGIEKAADYGPAHEAYAAADSVRPEGRVGRLEGLFCVESISEVARWVFSTSQSGPLYDPNPREIFYEGPEPWVYPVSAWSSIGLYEHRGVDEYRRRYWELGLPLREFEARRSELADLQLWQDGGEVILDPRFIRSSRPVSLKRLAEQAPPSFREAPARLQAWRRRYSGRDSASC